MPMIGSKAAPSDYDPSSLSFSQKLAILGAGLKDAAATRDGGDANNLERIQALLANTVLQGRRQAFGAQLAQLVGGGAGGDVGGQPPPPPPATSMGLPQLPQGPAMGGGPGSAPPPLPQVSPTPTASPAVTGTDDAATGRVPGGPPPSLGARALNLVGMNLTGVDILGLQRRQALERQRQQFGQDLGGEVGAASGGLTIDDPRLGPLLIEAQRLGYPMSEVMDLLKSRQPHVQVGPDGRAYNDKDASIVGQRFGNPTNVNGTVTDLNDPQNINRYIPEAPVKGAMPVYDNLGHVVDWTLPDGSRRTLQDASQATQTGQTFGTVYNNPNGDGSTTPTLGATMFGAGGRRGVAPGGGGAGGGFGAGAPVGGRPGRTLNPGEIAAQTVDYSEGAKSVAAAGDAGIKARNTANQYTQAFNDASALDTNNLTNFKLGTAKILSSLGYQNPDLDKFTNTAEGYRQLTTQMVLPLAKELGSNPSNRDAKIIQDSMPGLKTPRQVAMVTFASQAALQNKEAARQEFFANYDGPQSKSAMQRAWSQSEAAKRSVFQDPIFARLSIEGKPAVTIYPQPYKDGKRYGVFRPNTPFEQIFEVH